MSNKFVGYLQEYIYKSFSHGKLTVLVNVPLWLRGYLIFDGHDNLVRINLGLEAHDIGVPHFFLFVQDEVLSFYLDIAYELIGCRRVTNTLEEFDALFSLEVLQFSVIDQK